MISILLAKAAPYLIAIGAAIAALLGYGARQKARGRREAETDALRASAKRQEDGRDAVSDLRGADRDDLAQRLRDNDGQW